MDKRILFITDSLENGGLERQLALLVKYLPQGWEGRVWSMSDGPFRNVIENLNVRLDICMRTWQYDITPAFSLWRIIYEWCPDIVHAWGWMSCLAAAPICRAVKIPLIDGTIRMGMKSLRRKWPHWLGLKLADGVIANSRAGLHAWHISESKGKVIYNGFDPKRLELIGASNNKNKKFTVVMVGRMVKEKDFSSYINAARFISKNDKNWCFLAIGSGMDRPNLIENAQDLVESDIIRFPKPVYEVLPHLISADVGVLLSTPLICAEGCSNAIMEYMACKLPVICTQGGGNQEIVINGQTGFMIPAGDADSLVEKLRYLKNNRETALKMGEAGHKLFLDLFSVQRMVEETLSFYSLFK
jgi:glycosyltransferase involved in cell wall biosynthesis